MRQFDCRKIGLMEKSVQSWRDECHSKVDRDENLNQPSKANKTKPRHCDRLQVSGLVVSGIRTKRGQSEHWLPCAYALMANFDDTRFFTPRILTDFFHPLLLLTC